MRALQLLLLLILIAIVLYWLLRPRAVPARRTPAVTDELVKDPVCQTYVVRSRALSQPGPGGGAIYFCGPECARRYATEPRG